MKDSYTIRITLSDEDEIVFPVSMQKYPFKSRTYFLFNYKNVISKSILRRLIFLSISGYIGFDDHERVDLIKCAFLLEFDAFFEYLL